MKKTFRIFLYEYLRHVRRKRFIASLISMPLVVVVAIAAGWLIESLQRDARPAGYVDLSGWLSETEISGMNYEPAIPLIAYADEIQAGTALRDGEIQAFFVLQPDYLDSGHVALVSLDSPTEQVRDEFRSFLRRHLAAGQTPQIQQRLLQGSRITVRSADGTRHSSESELWNLLLPVFSGLLFIMAVNTGSGYLLQAVVEEKENRTIEILVSSVSPGQLMAGKILGNLSVGLTLLLSWALFAVAGLWLARDLLFPDFRLSIEGGVLCTMVFSLLPAFVMVGAMMAAIGASVTEMREAQQVSGIFSLFILMPFWFSSQLFLEPNSVLSLVLSIFPITAPVALSFRAIATEIPFWQMALSMTLLYGGAAASVWLAARAFRLGMLSYGRRLNLKELLKGPQP